MKKLYDGNFIRNGEKMRYSDYVKFAPVNLTYEEWVKLEAERLGDLQKTIKGD